MTERRFTCLPSLRRAPRPSHVCMSQNPRERWCRLSLRRAPRPSHACSLCARGRPPIPGRAIRVILLTGSSPYPSHVTYRLLALPLDTYSTTHTFRSRRFPSLRPSQTTYRLRALWRRRGGGGVLRVVSSLSESRIPPSLRFVSASRRPNALPAASELRSLLVSDSERERSSDAAGRALGRLDALTNRRERWDTRL